MFRLLAIAGILATLSTAIAAPRKLQTSSLLDIIEADADLGTFESAINAAVLNGRLCNTGNCTLFAPIDSAFADCIDPMLLVKLATKFYSASSRIATIARVRAYN